MNGQRMTVADLFCHCEHPVAIVVNEGDPSVCGLCFRIIHPSGTHAKAEVDAGEEAAEHDA